MLNIIKMDLYRMFHTKSMYVIWIILAAMMIFTTVMTAEVVGSDEVTQQQESTVNIGMSVDVPVEGDENVSVLAVIYGNAQAKFLALMMAIFAVIFSTADIQSGYIKSIGGQVKDRAQLVFSKAVALSMYVVLTMIFAVLLQMVANLCVFGYIELGNPRDFAVYVGVQTVLHIAFVLICLMIALVLRNNLVSMIIVVCISMNIMTLIYMGIDTLISNMGVKDFAISEYTVTGRITMLSMAPDSEAGLVSIIVAVVFGVVAMAITGIVFKKKDI